MFELEKPKAITMTFRQRIFVRYIMAILADLMILNLFVEFWDAVVIDSFTISILAAFVLQVLLRATMMLEHKVAKYFNSKPGKLNVILRWFTAWAILFGSKFIILFVIDLVFGARVEFSNIITFIVVVIAIILFEVCIKSLLNLQWMKTQEDLNK